MTIRVQTNVREENVRQRDEHAIFIEGNHNSIDVIIIDTLFKNNDISINVKTLG